MQGLVVLKRVLFAGFSGFSRFCLVSLCGFSVVLVRFSKMVPLKNPTKPLQTQRPHKVALRNQKKTYVLKHQSMHCQLKMKTETTPTWTPQQVVSGGFWVFKSFQKPPVGGYWNPFFPQSSCAKERCVNPSIGPWDGRSPTQEVPGCFFPVLEGL